MRVSKARIYVNMCVKGKKSKIHHMLGGAAPYPCKTEKRHEEIGEIALEAIHRTPGVHMNQRVEEWSRVRVLACGGQEGVWACAEKMLQWW